MLLFWLFLAVVLTVIGAIIALLTQDAADEHDQELEYEGRIGQQRAAIELARCDANPPCRSAHEHAEHMLAEHQKAHHGS